MSGNIQCGKEKRGNFLSLPSAGLPRNKGLRKELPSSQGTVIELFFRRLGKLLTDPSDRLFAGKTEVDFGAFTEELREHGCKLAENEAEKVFSGISVNGVLAATTFNFYMEKYVYECSSDRSSDISSSDISGDFTAEDLQEATEMYSLVIRQVPKDDFLRRLGQLPHSVCSDDLNRLMLESPFRLQEHTERTAFIRNVMKTDSKVPRALAVARVLESTYRHETGLTGQEQQLALEFVQRNYDRVLSECSALDLGKTGNLTWRDLTDIFASLEDLSEGVLFELKSRAYSYEQTLFSIPYFPLLNDTAQWSNR